MSDITETRVGGGGGWGWGGHFWDFWPDQSTAEPKQSVQNLLINIDVAKKGQEERLHTRRHTAGPRLPLSSGSRA